jgi:uncharacterized Zn-binding protein involved in type VI secretion
MHTCPVVSPTPHIGGAITGIGCLTVLIAGQPAATTGDVCTCVGPPDVIMTGSSGVFIGGKPAARMGDTTAHGGVIVGGCVTVLIGERRSRAYQKLDEYGNDDVFHELSEEKKAEFILQAIEDAVKLLERKLLLLNRRDPKTLKLFKLWFATDDEIAFMIITSRIEKELTILKSLCLNDFKIVEDEETRRYSYGMVYSGDEFPFVYLGDLFWNPLPSKKITKAFVLIHEISHFDFVGMTEDFDYGVSDCLSIAEKSRFKALYNADTFAYFIEQ